MAGMLRQLLSGFSVVVDWIWYVPAVPLYVYHRRIVDDAPRGPVSILIEVTESNEMMCIAASLFPASDRSTLYYYRSDGSFAAFVDVRGFPKVGRPGFDCPIQPQLENQR